MRGAFICPLAVLLLPAVLAAPVQSQTADTPAVSVLPTIDPDQLAKIAEQLQSIPAPTATVGEQIPTSILEPTPTPLSKEQQLQGNDEQNFEDPPPIWDPPEPRPETIFDAPPETHDRMMKPPPIPKHRMEHLSAFDGARAHPEKTVYQADPLDNDTSCPWYLAIMKITASITAVIAVAFAVVYACESVARLCLRVVRGRNKESGQIKLDEKSLPRELGAKHSTAEAAGSALSGVCPRSRSLSKTCPA